MGDDAGIGGVLAEWRLLEHAERERLLDLVHRLLTRVRWEAARGFELTDDMPLTVAAHASMLLLGLDIDDFRDLRAIVIHPTTITLHGERAGPAPGLRSRGRFRLSGQTGARQPMLLSWREVHAAVRLPGRGRNVVVHEFAHELDALDGISDGTPPIDSPRLRDRWIAECTPIYEALHAGHTDAVIRSYAGTNPSEFFAVVSELFFDDPLSLRRDHPGLYQVLSDAYGQDPAERRARGATTGADPGGAAS